MCCRIFLFLPSQLYQCLTNKIYLSNTLTGSLLWVRHSMKYWKCTRTSNKYMVQPCGSQFSRGNRYINSSDYDMLHTHAEWEARRGENMKEVPVNRLEEGGDACNRRCDSQGFRERIGVARERTQRIKGRNEKVTFFLGMHDYILTGYQIITRKEQAVFSWSGVFSAFFAYELKSVFNSSLSIFHSLNLSGQGQQKT